MECDFCTLPSCWEYPCRHLIVSSELDDTGQLQTQLDERSSWQACPTCHELIEARDWDALGLRGLGAGCRFRQLNEDAKILLLVQAIALYKLFDQNRIAPALRLTTLTCDACGFKSTAGSFPVDQDGGWICPGCGQDESAIIGPPDVDMGYTV